MTLTYKQLKTDKLNKAIILKFGTETNRELKALRKTCKSITRWVNCELSKRKQLKSENEEKPISEHITEKVINLGTNEPEKVYYTPEAVKYYIEQEKKKWRIANPSYKTGSGIVTDCSQSTNTSKKYPETLT